MAYDLEDDIRWAEDELATAEDNLENAEKAIASDVMALRNRTGQLEQRKKNRIQLVQKVQYCKLDVKKRKDYMKQVKARISDLEITIELLKEDPGTEAKVKELEKELVEVNKLLTN